MSGAPIVVLGAGSLAHATCDALATVSPEPINVADFRARPAGRQPRNPAQTKGL
jgi:hypothetical protein